MNILVAVDLTDASKKIIDHAVRLAKVFTGKVWLLHVAEPDPYFVGYEASPDAERCEIARTFHKEHKQLQQWSNKLRSAGLDCTALLVQGPTVATILSEARKIKADEIVVGSHGKSAVKRLLFGSTSEGILHGSGVPVLIVPTVKRQNAKPDK